MRQTKRTLSLLLCMALLVAILPMAHAAGSNITATADKTSARVGDTVVVTIGVKGMTVSSFAGGISFDNAALECKSITGVRTGREGIFMKDSYDDWTGALIASKVDEANNTGNIGFALTGTENVSYPAQTIATVTFEVKAGGQHKIAVYEDSAGQDAFKSDSADEMTVNVPIDVTAVKLNKSALTLKVGGTDNLTATVEPAGANAAVTWSSDNAQVAAVQNGVVTAVGAGTATVTAKAGDKTATCAVTVSKNDAPAAPANVELWSKDANSISLKPIDGCEYSLDGQNWQDSPTFNNLEPNKDYTVSVRVKETDSQYASAVKTATFTTDKLEQIITAPETTSVSFGNRLDLNNVCQSNAQGAKLSFAVNGNLPEGTAFDADSGVLTAGTTEGEVEITITSGAVGDYGEAAGKTIKVTVSPKQASEFASGFDAEVTKTYGDAPFTKVAALAKGNGAVSYKSSDESVATVDNNGNVTVLGAGNATITATAEETDAFGAVSVAYNLSVSPKTITVSAKNKSAYVNDPKPELAADDYSVTGLVGADKLLKAPVLSYSSEPDMTKPGMVAIKAADAEAGKNYTVVYRDGALTISEPTSHEVSSGGSGTSSTGIRKPDEVTPYVPSGPDTPVTPGDPTAPTDPTVPSDPTTPTDPTTPVDPVTPADPTTSVTPSPTETKDNANNNASGTNKANTGKSTDTSGKPVLPQTGGSVGLAYSMATLGVMFVGAGYALNTKKRK